MYLNQIYQLTYQALYMILLLSSPVVLLSVLAGLIIAIFQAATQIQEQTLSFAVKLFTAILVILAMGAFLGAQIIQFASNIFTNFPRW